MGVNKLLLLECLGQEHASFSQFCSCHIKIYPENLGYGAEQYEANVGVLTDLADKPKYLPLKERLAYGLKDALAVLSLCSHPSNRSVLFCLNTLACISIFFLKLVLTFLSLFCSKGS